jgi:hypothetical protein
MTETQQRFLRAIAERVPREQVVEVHLFPPIRQGGVETGVAVVAEDPRPVATTQADGSSDAALVTASSDGVPAADATGSVDAMLEKFSPGADVVGEADAAFVGGEAAVEDQPSEAVVAGEREPHELDQEASALAESDPRELESDAADAEEGAGLELAPQATNGTSAPALKFTIHTARYRLTLKGVDRGKWDFDVVAEADAPLDAVDAVVRGVQRRAGEGAEPDRLTTDAFREALDAPLAQLEL